MLISPHLTGVPNSSTVDYLCSCLLSSLNTLLLPSKDTF